ncbi:unnamed protein product [Colias eurytheme]|nr:unnamed protein product [Colias eurytheme]
MLRFLILFCIIHIGNCEFCLGPLCLYNSNTLSTLCAHKYEQLFNETKQYEEMFKKLQHQLMYKGLQYQQQQKDCKQQEHQQRELCMALHMQQQKLIEEQQQQLRQLKPK